MSEFLAEARILVRPDTTKFRAELEASLAATLKPITIPVVPVVAGGISAATSETTAFTTAQTAAAAETQAVAAALEKEAIAATQATAATSGLSKSAAGVARGAGASALSLLGVRGATLAASGAFLAGTAAVVGFSKALQSAAAFETELNVFKVTSGATADELDRVSASAKQLGRDLTLPGITASDAAVAMTELAKAGLSVRDSMAAARGTLQLATAAQISNAEAAKLVSGALNSFQLDGTQAVKVADLFAGAAASAQGSIQDFGPALGQASAVAHAFGLSIGDTVTLLTELAKAGIQGGRAGTSLRVALLRLVNPPADAAKALKALNVQVRDINGNLRPQIFADIETALQGVSKAQRQATEATIFGSDAIRTQVILGQQGVKGFDEISAAVNRSGLAQEQAAARTQGLQGDFENLSNQVSSLGLTIGQVASGPVHLLVSGLADTLSQVNTVADGVVVLSGKFKDLGNSIADSDPVIGAVADHLDLIGKGVLLINPVTRALALTSFAMKKFGIDAEDASKKTELFGNIAKNAASGVDALADALNRSAAALKAQQPTDQGLTPKEVLNVVGGFDAKQVRDKIAGDNAQLLADLQTEQDFLIRQLQRQAVKNRPALKRALEQELLGVVTDINTITDKAKKDTASALLESQSVARQEQQNLIEAASQTPGIADDVAAQKRLRQLVLAQIAAVNTQITDQKARRAALVALNAVLIQVNGALKNITATQKQAAEERRQAQQTLRDETLNAKLSAADLTASTADNKRIFNLQIKELNEDIARQKAIAAKAKEGSKIQLDALIQIQKDIQRINVIKGQIKGLQGQGGFSLADFFKEAVANFQTFGSNITGRSGILSPQDARASVGGSVAAQLGAQLAESKTQTALLTQIAVNTGLGARQARTGSSDFPSARGAGSWSAALAASNGYG